MHGYGMNRKKRRVNFAETQRRWLVSACFLGVIFSVSACSDPEKASYDPLTKTPVETPERRALKLESTSACAIDDDCAEGLFCFQQNCALVCTTDSECASGETCSPRGRCSGEEGAVEVAHSLPELRVLSYPETIRVVGAGEETVTFDFGLNKNMPAEGVAYRVERSDGLGDPARIYHATGTNTFRVTVETGAAKAGSPVLLRVISAIGDFELLLQPDAEFEGAWGGTISVDNLGSTQKFELAAYILGDDVNALSMVLPVDSGTLFSPRDHHDPARDYERVALQYDAQLNVYQAVFVHEYRFEGSLFGELRARQVERTLRFDFDADQLKAGHLEGRVTDLWRGLYDGQRASGAREVGTVRYDGSFELSRVGGLPRAATDFVVGELTAPQPGLIERGKLDLCTNASFAVSDVQEGAETWSCAGITSVEAFRQASPGARASCALSVARAATQGETTSSQLAKFFAEEGGAQAVSFEQFLQACADDSDDLCQPSAQALCGYQLVSYAAEGVHRSNLGNDGARADALLSELMIALGEMSGEAFIARQLGAFYNDLALRKQWLQNQTAPALFLDAVESANVALLEDWTAQVLDVQHEVFTRFFSQDVLTFLSRPLNGDEPNARRAKLLEEASTLWRGYADALMLAASRWNEVVRDSGQRTMHARRLQQQALELYLVMGMLQDFGRITGASGTTSSVVGLASNFGQLTDKINRLNASFDDTVFARDAEVVVARSLNPLSDNNSLLSERRDHALATVAAARTAIEGILNEVTIEALQEADLRTRINNERRVSANRIAELCGLPAGCTETDLLVRRECVVVAAGECGLLNAANLELDSAFDPSRVAASEAGRAILSVLEAFHNVAIQDDELAGHLAKLELQYADLEAFKNDVEDWNLKRLEGVDELRVALAQIDTIRDQRVRDIMQNLDSRARMRSEQIRAMQNRFAEWDKIRRGQIESSYRGKLDELAEHRKANLVESAGEKTAAGLMAAAEALPKTAGASTDPFANTRASLVLVSMLTSISSKYQSSTMRLAADQQTIARERNEELTGATLASMAEQAELAGAIRDNEMAELEEALMLSNQLRDDEIERIREALELMREQREAELAYSRDMAEFRQRRSDYLQEMVDISGYILRTEQSRFNVLQRVLEYDNFVQKARLEAARLQELDRQLIDLDNLVGSIGAVFTRSYTLERTENHLDAARAALMDWLVVIEYYAVRPFIAQRVQILLARNAYQLEAIADKLRQLENTCGGSERSKATATLSLRKQVLGLNHPQLSTVSGEVLSPDERFRRWLQQSYVPADRRIRFSTSESLSDVLQRTDSVLSASFTLGLNDFANLKLACNAKIESVAVQLVGELGEAQPTATILYDGTSQLRSCQPNIAEYVRSVAPGRTSYDTITQLRTAGRAMSPLAGVNEFPRTEQSVNRSLAGLPVSSEYTLLLSTRTGDNAKLDWSKLEDVLIQVEYSYQDLFAESCD